MSNNNKNSSSWLTNNNKRHHFVRIDELFNRYEPPQIPTLFRPFQYPQQQQQNSGRLNDDPNDKEWNRERHVPYTSCLFENICINRRGEWILYTHSKHAHAMNHSRWVHTSVYPQFYKSSSLRIRVERPPTQILDHQGNVLKGTSSRLSSSNLSSSSSSNSSSSTSSITTATTRD
ncbi:hypothetical protein FDP41_008358 [Naegleria fowleri]|uniref:Uncharacterized protein n=1 Tax=Naegleria fowleri TaxID=5763 RepID=A0A6A5BF64_NAEFO|nr:uncharacterized protein FDP41_008358 [Naegleria fowleri]KAF0973151.1 hypothetical protein FDP41_008358 [Naegleria fowleri]